MPRQLKIVGGVAALAVVLLGGVLAVGGVQDEPANHHMPDSGHMAGPGNHTGSMGAGHSGGGAHTRPAGHHGTQGNQTNGTRGPVTWTVELKDDAFHANNLTIQRGDTVKWIHAGNNPHTISADDRSFDSHPDCHDAVVDGALGRCMANGASYTRTFESVGTVPYKCKLHHGMAATIDVRESYSPTPDTNHHG